MEALADKYRGQVNFVFIYCKEAHVSQAEPIHSWAERLAQARKFARKMNAQQRVLVDDMEEQSVQHLYGACESSIFVLDATGQVLLKLPMSAPGRIDAFLRDYLASDSSSLH